MLKKKVDLCSIHKYKKAYAEAYLKKSSAIVKHIEEIKASPSTREIHYPEYKSSFDYVDKKFPGKGVKDVVVFLCSKALLKMLGYTGIGGFFEKVLKTIIICNEGAIDETIVHEMLHYVSDVSMSKSYSVGIEEEFAYINSIDYLRVKGQTDEYIMKKVFLPYLMGTIDSKKIIKQVFTPEDILLYNKNIKSRERIYKKYKSEINSLIEQEAIILAENLIKLHDKKGFLDPAVEIKDDNGFDLMEF